MGWQLTTLAHRLGLMVGRSHQDVGSRRGPLVDARQAALDKATAGLGPSARLRYEGILADHPHAVDAVQRTVAATRSVAAADELARRWVSLTAAQRLAVLD
ncbi:MAG: hypothetical protein HGA44_05815, partial [Cellulomonadaceae bacterium]|nr:hypothetical protein [Cellulomonadaceae bacterium]